MKTIAAAFTACVLVLAALSARADGWSDWKMFVSHNGVVLEWRTFSHPEHDTMADWKVTNNTAEVLFFLALGTRTYTCSNGSDAFPQLRTGLGGVELRPGSSVTLSDGGAANYVRGDATDRASCPRIVGARFESTAYALEFALGGPHEPVKPWIEHNFAKLPHTDHTEQSFTPALAQKDAPLSRDRRMQVQHGLGVLGYNAGPVDGLFGPRTRAALRDWQDAKGFDPTGYVTTEQAEALIAVGSDLETAVLLEYSAVESVPAEKQASKQSSESSTESANQVLVHPYCGRDVPEEDGTWCGLELANRPDCYVYVESTDSWVHPTWSGECLNNVAHGSGTLSYGETERTGGFVHGKKHGHWVEHCPVGDCSFTVTEGPYVDGKRHGHWVWRDDEWGNSGEGPYADGKRHGHWVETKDGGSDVSEGPYVDGKKHGHWVLTGSKGLTVHEGPYVEDKRHGHWVLRRSDGAVSEGPYVDGKKHGHWVEKDGRGWDIDEGSYVEGKRHGKWVTRLLRLGKVTYNHYRHGKNLIFEGK